MITRATFTFLQQQEAIFQAKMKRAPSTSEVEDLKGPALMIGIRHTPPHGQPTIQLPPAVAFIDTGADRTTIEFEFVEAAYRAANRPSPLHFWTVRPRGYETHHFAVEIGGVPVPTRTGNVVLLYRKYMPGYEQVLVGRDLLKQLTLCCSTDTFTLTDPLLVPIRSRTVDPCCR